MQTMRGTKKLDEFDLFGLTKLNLTEGMVSTYKYIKSKHQRKIREDK